MMFLQKVICFILLLLVTGVTSAQPIKEIKIWLNAFIPGTIPVEGSRELTAVIKAGEFANKTAIEGPFGPAFTRFYLTDNRDFSQDKLAKARAHSEVLVDVTNSAINAALIRNDSTYSFSSLEEGVVTCRSLADAKSINIINKKAETTPSGSKLFEFTFDGSSKNPCFQTVAGNPSPNIDWNVAVKVEVICGEIAIVGATGRIENFPAFEMYVEVNGIIKPVFQLKPTNAATPSDLFGPATRLLSDVLNPPKSILLGTDLTGTWQSNDVNGRFNLKISGNEVEWTEKFPETGIVTTRKVPLAIKNGQFRIERSNNDVEVLRMLGYAPDIQVSIAQANPNPSFITFCISNGSLEAKWNGLIVKKTPQGKFDKIVQPGESAAKPFTFIKK